MQQSSPTSVNRFVEIPTCSLSAEWNISDGQVQKRSQNYRRYFTETSTKIPYLEIINDAHVLYIQHDVQQAMKNQRDQWEEINRLFLQAVRDNDVTKVIHAYTLDGRFFRVLNHHLAICVSADDVEKMKIRKTVKMHYWEGPLDIATIFVCHPSLENLRFKQGIVFRGLCIKNEEDLREYQTIGNRLLNKTFVSTSQDQNVAMMFAGVAWQTETAHKCCLLKYTLIDSGQRTALDIHTLSQFPEEKEVLLLPYANFQVTNYQHSRTNPNLIDIELRECRLD